MCQRYLCRSWRSLAHWQILSLFWPARSLRKYDMCSLIMFTRSLMWSSENNSSHRQVYHLTFFFHWQQFLCPFVFILTCSLTSSKLMKYVLWLCSLPCLLGTLLLGFVWPIFFAHYLLARLLIARSLLAHSLIKMTSIIFYWRDILNCTMMMM